MTRTDDLKQKSNEELLAIIRADKGDGKYLTKTRRAFVARSIMATRTSLRSILGGAA